MNWNIYIQNIIAFTIKISEDQIPWYKIEQENA